MPKKKNWQRQKSKSSKVSSPKNKAQLANRSSKIVTKEFEIFVTDFLTNPCGIPVELRECVLVDSATPLIDTTDSSSSNSCQVLKKIYSNNESLDDFLIDSKPLVPDEPLLKVNDNANGIEI